MLGTAGIGYEAGVLVKPTRERYRIAVAAKSPIDAQLSAPPGVAPTTANIPWEVERALVAGTQSRIHAAGGFDVKLLKCSVFGLLAPFDYWQLSRGANLLAGLTAGWVR